MIKTGIIGGLKGDDDDEPVSLESAGKSSSEATNLKGSGLDLSKMKRISYLDGDDKIKKEMKYTFRPIDQVQ